MKILIVEDDNDIVAILKMTIELRWPEANLLSTSQGKTGVELVEKEKPDLVLLDLGLPDIDGFQVLSQIRSFSEVPIIILTVRADETNQIRGLELGADDYIIKPFSPSQFIARMQSIMRRAGVSGTKTVLDEAHFVGGELSIDFTNQEVMLAGQPVKLSYRVYDLLYHLVTHEGNVVSNQTLLKEVFPEQQSDPGILYGYMKILREKMGDDSGIPKMILNEGTKGYKFISP